MKRIRLPDVAAIVFSVLAGISGIIYCVNTPEGSSIRITTPYDSYRYSLNKDRIIHVTGLDGDYTIEIHGAKVRALRSNCPHQICVLRGWVYRAGDSIVCVPNHIIIKILNEDQELDAITE